jgi:phenylacetate-coenzyme A ligase PaaK-like adenylate-forming protein
MTFKPHFSWDLLSREEITARSLRAFKNNLTYIQQRLAAYTDLTQHIPEQTPATHGDIEKNPFFDITSLQNILYTEHTTFPETRESLFLNHPIHGTLPLVCSKSDLDRRAYDLSLFLHMNGITPGSRVIQSIGIFPGNPRGISLFQALNSLQTHNLRISENADNSRQMEICTNFKASFFIGTPTSIVEYTRKAPQLMKTIQRFFIIYDAWETELTRENRKELLNLPAIEILHFPLCSLFISQCGIKEGFHTHPELGYFEIIDKNNEAVPEGKNGEIVITPFGIRGIPLLRFKTGVTGKMVFDPCACGKMSPRLLLSPEVFEYREKSLHENPHKEPTAEKLSGESFYSRLIRFVSQELAINNFILVRTQKSQKEEIHLYAEINAREVSRYMQSIYKEFKVSIPVLTSNAATIKSMKERLIRIDERIYE